MTESELKTKLEHVQRLIADLSTNLRKAEAIRDGLIQRLCDSEGAHDRHPVAVR